MNREESREYLAAAGMNISRMNAADLEMAAAQALKDYEEVKVYALKLEETMKKFAEQEKIPGSILSGPEIIKDVAWYRISAGSRERLVNYNPKSIEFGETPDELSKGDDVVVVGECIISVTPKRLQQEREPIDVTKLVRWEEIGGMKSQIQTIRDAIETPLKNAKLAKKMGVRPLKGAMLYGGPGLGKTLIGKAIARTILETDTAEADAFIYMKGAEVLHPHIGMAEMAIRAIFTRARRYAERSGKRAILFIDEADAILPRRGSKISSDVESTIVPAFLAEMDGFDDNSPFILLATNRPDTIDDAAIREGRIDLKLEIKQPNKDDGRDIFEIHLKNIMLSDSMLELSELGAELVFQEETAWRASGAMIAAMVNLAASNALGRYTRDDNSPLGVVFEDMRTAYDKINFGKTEKKTNNETETTGNRVPVQAGDGEEFLQESAEQRLGE